MLVISLYHAVQAHQTIRLLYCRGESIEKKVEEAFGAYKEQDAETSNAYSRWAETLDDELEVAFEQCEAAPALERSNIRIACHCMPNDLLPSFFLPVPNDHMIHSLRLWKRTNDANNGTSSTEQSY